MLTIKEDVFRAYDIRGVVDRDFDPQWVKTLGQACGTYFLEKGFNQAVVGHDCRHSSPIYQEKMIEGLLSTGVDVVFINMVPTPVFYFAVKTLNKKAGVMITASHNPPEFNGFKIWTGENTIHTTEIKRIYQIMASGNFAHGQGVATELNITPKYLQELSSQTQLKNSIKVVVDGGNGSGGLICAQLLEQIGAQVIPLFCEPDPNFPNHHPDPTVLENIKTLQETVKREKALLGIGLDGDGDRIGVIDEQGRIIFGDKLLAIYAREVLRAHPQATIIGEVKCSHLLFTDIAKHGGQPLMWKTGHSLIKAKMKEIGALLAGEMSGHMFFADRYYGFDDALYAAQRLVEIIDHDPTHPLSTYLQDWPKTYNTPEIRMECPEKIKFQVVEQAKNHFRDNFPNLDIVTVDGIRINFNDGWGLLRASNTQPVLVLRFEAETEKRLKEIRDFFETPLQQWIKERL